MNDNNRGVISHIKPIIISFILAFGSLFIGVEMSRFIIEIISFILSTTETTITDSTATIIERTVSATATQIIGKIGIAMLFLYITGRGITYLQINKPDRDELIIAFVLPFFLIFTSVVAQILRIIFGVTGTTTHGTMSPEITLPLLIVNIIISIFIVGVAEEILYRGVIQEYIKETIPLNEIYSNVFAVLLASIIFAIAHIFSFTGPFDAIMINIFSIFLSGIILGSVYAYTNNLLIPIIGHGLQNTIIFISNFGGL